jgi:hypothetical protein
MNQNNQKWIAKDETQQKSNAGINAGTKKRLVGREQQTNQSRQKNEFDNHQLMDHAPNNPKPPLPAAGSRLQSGLSNFIVQPKTQG